MVRREILCRLHLSQGVEPVLMLMFFIHIGLISRIFPFSAPCHPIHHLKILNRELKGVDDMFEKVNQLLDMQVLVLIKVVITSLLVLILYLFEVRTTSSRDPTIMIYIDLAPITYPPD